LYKQERYKNNSGPNPGLIDRRKDRQEMMGQAGQRYLYSIKGITIMAKRKDELKTRIKKEVLHLLKEKGLQISKIVLFGSYAKEIENNESDVDLIIVSKDFRNKTIFERIDLTSGINKSLVKTFQKPFDLMFYSDQEWEEPYSIVLNEAQESGKLLYSV
jgi:predicted nucleotidyltransferase